MPTFEEARKIILASVAPLGAERVDLLSAFGRVLAENATAPWDLPLCDNSAMDGFAVRAADCRKGASLRVTGNIPAGEAPTVSCEPGCAVRIMTGAPVPPGCDAIVPIEETDGGSEIVVLDKDVKPGQHIRVRGEDVRGGDVVLSVGTVVAQPEISLLASLNRAVVPVVRRARVAILSTGDELIDLGAQPSGGRIVNSNSLSLAASVREAGGEPASLGIAPDDRESHLARLKEGLKADALVTSAGVSSGDRDLVRDCLAELGVRQLFWRPDIKPGGPLAFGMKGGTPVFSLPGNPVSAMVTFEEFVRPALLKMMGHRRVIKPQLRAILREEVRKKPGKVHFMRVRIDVENGVYRAASAGDQHTAILTTLVRANGIAVLAKEKTVFAAGEEVPVHYFRGVGEMTEE